MDRLNEWIALAQGLDTAIFMTTTLLFGFVMILLLKRKNKNS